MPQNSVLYAMGRISSLEDKLIDTAKLERMLQAPHPYGEPAGADGGGLRCARDGSSPSGL